MSEQFSRTMQLRREELLRELPKAVGEREHQVNGDHVSVLDGDKRVEMDITETGEKTLGALDLPTLTVSFDFQGFSHEEVEAFMAHFDRHTLRFGAV